MDWSEENKLGSLLVRPEYLDVAGDLASGVLLSQIVYWFRPKIGGGLKVQVWREGRFWIAKSMADWKAECRLGQWQVGHAITKLVSLGLIQTRFWQFAGAPRTHIWLDTDRLMKLVNALPPNGVGATPGSPGPTLGKPQGPLPGNLKVHVVVTSGSYKETKEKTTEEILAPAQKPKQVESQKAPGKQMPTLKDILEAKAQVKHGPEAVWKAKMAQEYGGFQKPMTVKERAQLKSTMMYFAEQVEDQGILAWVIQNWLTVTTEVRVAEGLKHVPDQPVIGWILQYRHRVLDAWKANKDSAASPATAPALQLIAKAVPVVAKVVPTLDKVEPGFKTETPEPQGMTQEQIEQALKLME